MSSLVSIVFSLVLVIIGGLPPSVQASHPIVNSPTGSGVLVEARVSINTPIRLKACFSSVWREDTDTNPSGLECTGETWNKDEWLSQNAGWQQFTPYLVVNSHVRTLLGVRSIGDSQKPYLYIIGLGEAESSTHRIRLPIHFTVIPESGDRKVVIQLDTKQFGPSGWLVIQTQTGPSWRIWNQDQVPVLTDSNLLSLGYQFDINSKVEYPNLYQLDQPGVYSLRLPPTPRDLYQPRITGTANPFVSTPNSFFVETEKIYLDPVEWYLDGHKLADNKALKITNLKLSPGMHTLGVKLLDTNEWSQTTLQVRPYPWVKFENVLPVAAIGGREKIVLKNSGPVEIDLDGWQIVSQTSRRSLTLVGRIAPAEQMAVEPKGFLANEGGVYSLVDPYHGVIDQLTYPEVPVEVNLERAPNSIVWLNQPGSVQLDYVTISGTVTNRRGKSLDIDLTQNTPRHLVVATEQFPTVRVGQFIKLTGVERKTVLGNVEYRIIGSTKVEVTIFPKRMPLTSQEVWEAKLQPPPSLETNNRQDTPIIIRPPPPINLVQNDNQIELILIALILSLGVLLMSKNTHYIQNQ